MNRLVQTWTAWLALGLALVLSLVPVASARAADPAAIADAYIAATALDPEAIINMVTDDVTLRIVPPPPGTTGVWSGKDQARDNFESSKSQNVHEELVGSWQVTGDTATGTVLVTVNDFGKWGAGAVPHQYDFVLPGGKIKSWTGTMAELERARVQAAAQAYATAHPAPAPTCDDPLTVVHAWEAASEAGDADAAAALFTDDGVITLQPPPPGSSGIFRGKAQIQEFLHGFGAGKIHSTATYEVSGNVVTATGVVALPSLAQVGIPSVAFTAVFVVQNCKLASFSPTNHFTPEQEAILRAAGPPPGMPTSGRGAVAESAWWLVLGSLGSIGVGVLLLRAASRRRWGAS
jgi:ketosteroid isomerase-like protein